MQLCGSIRPGLVYQSFQNFHFGLPGCNYQPSYRLLLPQRRTTKNVPTPMAMDSGRTNSQRISGWDELIGQNPVSTVRTQKCGRIFQLTKPAATESTQEAILDDVVPCPLVDPVGEPFVLGGLVASAPENPVCVSSVRLNSLIGRFWLMNSRLKASPTGGGGRAEVCGEEQEAC